MVIPARLNSKRLPGKVLIKFDNKSMIEHVWQRAKLAAPNNELIVVTDNQKIAKECSVFGAQVAMTSKQHSNGLSRISEISGNLDWDFFIVLQADELLLPPENIKKLIYEIEQESKYDVFNLITKLNFHDLGDRNVVKCAVGNDDNIITFFRKNWLTTNYNSSLNTLRKVCGIYALSKQTMHFVKKHKTQILERNESIEQFKFLELGRKIKGVNIPKGYISINTPKDLIWAKKIIKTDQTQKKIISIYNHL